MSKRDDLLRLLADGNWHDWSELTRVGGTRYSAEIERYRRLGYQIESERLEVGQGKRYRLPTMQLRPVPQTSIRIVCAADDVRRLVKQGEVTDNLRVTMAKAWKRSRAKEQPVDGA